MAIDTLAEQHNFDGTMNAFRRSMRSLMPNTRMGMIAAMSRVYIQGSITNIDPAVKQIRECTESAYFSSTLYPVESSLLTIFTKNQFDMLLASRIEDISHEPFQFHTTHTTKSIMGVIHNLIATSFDTESLPKDAIAKIDMWGTSIAHLGKGLLQESLLPDKQYIVSRSTAKFTSLIERIHVYREHALDYIEPLLASPIRFTESDR